MGKDGVIVDESPYTDTGAVDTIGDTAESFASLVRYIDSSWPGAEVAPEGGLSDVAHNTPRQRASVGETLVDHLSSSIPQSSDMQVSHKEDRSPGHEAFLENIFTWKESFLENFIGKESFLETFIGKESFLENITGKESVPESIFTGKETFSENAFTLKEGCVQNTCGKSNSQIQQIMLQNDVVGEINGQNDGGNCFQTVANSRCQQMMFSRHGLGYHSKEQGQNTAAEIQDREDIKEMDVSLPATSTSSGVYNADLLTDVKHTLLNRIKEKYEDTALPTSDVSHVIPVKLTPEEKAKVEKRKEANRKSAARHRQRQKSEIAKIKGELETIKRWRSYMEKSQQQIIGSIKALHAENNYLKRVLIGHICKTSDIVQPIADMTWTAAEINIPNSRR